MKPKTRIAQALLLIAAGALLILAACTPSGNSTTETVPTSPPKSAEPQGPELEGDPVRGGQLYDTWWAVGGDAEGEHMEDEPMEGGDAHEHEGSGPDEDHPLWAGQSSNTRSGADTWRCKECHGWDYMGVDGAYGTGSHLTGFVGVYDSREKPPSEVLASLKGSTNPDHDFSQVMDEQDLIDLALFITSALIDTTDLIGTDGTSLGDGAAGEALYVGVCIFCHGPEGNAINFAGLDEPEFVGHVAADNPWEFVHKVRFGQPGWPMPSSIVNGWSNEDVANVMAYAQTLSQEAFLSDGGQLYDNWWSTLGLPAPETDNLLWAGQTTNTRSGADTWRCKECHGWDYLGADGAYGSGSHATGFPGILAAGSSTAEEMLSWLSGAENPDHDFSAVMDDTALAALVAFIRNEMQDITAYVNADGTVNGDPAAGKTMFEGTCAACHGVDGRTINFGDADEPEYVGTVAAENPWEFVHKASFGQPGHPMPRGLALGWVLEQIADLLAYAQTLPTQ